MVRICVMSVPLFRAGGLELNERWQSVAADAGPKAIAAVRDHHGRFLRVHPDDRDKLAELGLAYVNESSPLTAATKAAPKPTTNKPEAVKADAPKPGKPDGKKE